MNLLISIPPFLTLCCFLGLAVFIVIQGRRTKIQGLVDNIFSKGKYDYQKTIKDVSRMIASVLNLDEIAKHVMDTVVNVMKVDFCGLFLCDLSESGCKHFASRGKYCNLTSSISMADTDSLIQYFKRQRQPVIKKKLMQRSGEPDIPDVLSDMNRLYAEIILPMIFEKRLSGFIVLGEKLSGDLFTPEDMDLLETLSSQCALAVEGKKGLILLTTRFDNGTRHVIFECEDNGPGISKSHRQDIFKPFFTTKEPGKGTGLGLYICHEIIRKHGGVITVEDSERQGTKFVVRLPVDG